MPSLPLNLALIITCGCFAGHLHREKKSAQRMTDSTDFLQNVWLILLRALSPLSLLSSPALFDSRRPTRDR